MGLNAFSARYVFSRAIPPKQEKSDVDGKINEEKEDNSSNGTETNSVTPINPDDKVENLINQYTYFEVYSGITSSLGNFYSETLAKIKAPNFFAKRFFNPIYNNTLNGVINSALERAKSGEKLDYAQLAQEVKDNITAILEACDYSPEQYMRNQIDENINNGYNLFNQ